MAQNGNWARTTLALSSSPAGVSQSKVSVVLTCYNYGRYLRASLDSILMQTYPDVEVIVVNDGSVDDTDKIMKDYLFIDNVRYFKQPNLGSSRARNAGVEHASGRFVAFLDADDLWRSDKLEKQLPLFRDERVGVVYSGMRFIDPSGKEVPVKGKVRDKYRKPKAGMVSRDILFANFVPLSSAVVRRECFDRVGGFDESLEMGMDWDLFLRISLHFDFAFAGEPLISYRTGHAGQLSNNLDLRKRCENKIMKKFLGDHPKVIPEPVVRKALTYHAISRGINWRHRDLRRSNRYFAAAMKKDIFAFPAYVGLLKNLAVFLLRTVA